MTCSITNFEAVKQGTIADMLLVTLGPFTVLFIMTSHSHLLCSVPWGLKPQIYVSRESMKWVQLIVQVRPS